MLTLEYGFRLAPLVEGDAPGVAAGWLPSAFGALQRRTAALDTSVDCHGDFLRLPCASAVLQQAGSERFLEGLAMASARSSAYKHFVLDSNGSYKCGVTDDAGKACGTAVSQKKGGSGSTPAFNMKRHLQRQHPEVFKTVVDADAPPPKRSRVDQQATAPDKRSQQSLTR